MSHFGRQPPENRARIASKDRSGRLGPALPTMSKKTGEFDACDRHLQRFDKVSNCA